MVSTAGVLSEMKRLETAAGDQETEKDRLRVNDWLEETNEMIQQ